MLFMKLQWGVKKKISILAKIVVYKKPAVNSYELNTRDRIVICIYGNKNCR